jgi:hypothetical protein
MYDDDATAAAVSPAFWAGGAISLAMWATVTMLALQWM